jgi:hypothetical protein
MKSWKIRLGLMLTMLAMLLAVAVPASAQTLYAQYPPGECWVDEWGYTWCPWDPSLVAPAAAPVVETVEQVDEEEADIESSLDDVEDLFADLEDFEEDFDEDEFDFDEDEFDEDEFDFDEDEFDEDELNRLLISDFDDDDDDDEDDEDDEDDLERFLLEEF